METSSIGAASAAYAYSPAVTGASTGGEDFASLLSSQMTADETTAATTTGADEAALNAYNPGQVTAYSLESGETAETAAGEETAATGAKPGYPAEVGQEWVPKGMQFYDSVYKRWVDDDIPHRFNENGDLEYYYEGQWYLDVAVRHRMVYTNGEEEIAVDVSEGEEGEASLLAEGEEAAGEELASLSIDEYFNEVLGMWKIFNLPSRTNEEGLREYYWGDAWRPDVWQHRTA
ncbi:MAG: hypothetical protein ACOZHQ_07810 [Thermodesulfobacteriota bacterium]